jgi:hypothetical protein
MRGGKTQPEARRWAEGIPNDLEYNIDFDYT